MVTTPILSEYRTRLTGLLDLDKEALAKAIASSVYAYFVHHLTSRMSHPNPIVYPYQGLKFYPTYYH